MTQTVSSAVLSPDRRRRIPLESVLWATAVVALPPFASGSRVGSARWVGTEILLGNPKATTV